MITVLPWEVAMVEQAFSPGMLLLIRIGGIEHSDRDSRVSGE